MTSSFAGWKSGWDVLLEHPLAPKKAMKKPVLSEWRDGGDVITMSLEAFLAKKRKKQKQLEELMAARSGSTSGGPGGTTSWSGTRVGTAAPVTGVATTPTTTAAVSTGGA